MQWKFSRLICGPGLVTVYSQDFPSFSDIYFYRIFSDFTLNIFLPASQDAGYRIALDPINNVMFG
jgi:hypothetical protein